MTGVQTCALPIFVTGKCEGEEIFQSGGEFFFRALFDPLTGQDEGGDGGRGVEKERRWDGIHKK